MANSRTEAVGFTGAFGSGCTTAADYLHFKRGFKVLRLSDQLLSKWKNKKTKPPRSWLQDMGDRLRKEKGNGVLVELALSTLSSFDKIAIDGIRNVAEVNVLRERFGYGFNLVGVVSSSSARWDRIGVQKYSDDEIGVNQFARDDQRDAGEDLEYGQQVSKCIDKADYLIDNADGVTLGVYKDKLLECIDLFSEAAPRDAKESEIFMNMAFSAAHSSRCCKRHVGAVVIDGNGNVVGVGYNENPWGTLSCQEQYQGCSRDQLRLTYINRLAKQGCVCPVCATPIKPALQVPVSCTACTKRKKRTYLDQVFFPDRAMSWCTAIHAEVWALSAAGERARGGELYTTTYPCMQCAEKIAHAGVKRVFYTEPYPDKLSRDRLEIAKVELVQFEGVRSASFERVFAPKKPA